MAEPEVEAAWQAEFKRIHDTEAFDSGLDDPMAAFRWSGDEAEARRLQEEHTHHYLRWTLRVGYERLAVLQLSEVQGALSRRQSCGSFAHRRDGNVSPLW
jgi:glycine/D-amino acid oxidase-like deaminating enzyme